MSSLLKLTKAQNLSCSTRMLSISPHLQQKPNNSEDVNESALLLRAMCVVSCFYTLKRSRRWFSVSSVVTFPTHKDLQGLLKATQTSPPLTKQKNKQKQNTTYCSGEKKHEWNPATYPGCTTDWSWPPAARQKELFKHTHTHAQAPSHYTHTLLLPCC